MGSFYKQPLLIESTLVYDSQKLHTDDATPPTYDWLGRMGNLLEPVRCTT